MLNKDGIRNELNKNIFVEDTSINDINDCYVPVYLSNHLKVYDTDVIDMKKSNSFKDIFIDENGYTLEPNKLYIGSTTKFTKTYNYVPMLTSFEELAVCGVEIHVTAGFGDNGFEGTWTLEIVSTEKVTLYPNMLIGRTYYHQLVGDPSITYKGKYLGQIEPTESRIEREYTRVLSKGDK